MISYNSTNLYGLQSQKYLAYLLRIRNKNFFKQSYVLTCISPYIDNSGKPRLIEAPSDSLKKIQQRIKIELNKIAVPYNVFSGVPGRSSIQNAEIHKNNKFIFKIDLSAFFPHITRQSEYLFFKDTLKESPDVAEIITNLTTVDLSLCKMKDPLSVNSFIEKKKIKTTNHLISGSPCSQILSYLVNQQMFGELQQYSNKNNITMSIYVDDITFSSNNNISYENKRNIYKIISKYFYPVSRHKIKSYSANYPKEITGSIIAQNTLKVPNRLSYKIIREFKYYKKHPDDKDSLNRLRGLLIAARQNEPDKFKNIYQFILLHSK